MIEEEKKAPPLCRLRLSLLEPYWQVGAILRPADFPPVWLFEPRGHAIDRKRRLPSVYTMGSED